MNRENNHHRPSCPHCHAKGSVTRPYRAWRLALVAGWLVMAAMVMIASLIGPFILAVGPIIAASGAGLLSFLHGKVSEPATCDACGKIVEAPVAPVVTRAHHAPARAAA